MGSNVGRGRRRGREAAHPDPPRPGRPAPAGFVAAGLALWPVLAASLSGAPAWAEDRIPVVATFLVAISGVTVGGIGSALWSLVVGLAFWAWYRPQPAAAPA